jgi:hypothetical protein
MPQPIDVLREWHDTYLLLGSASATLIGLLFVAASVGASYFTKDKHPGLRSFLSPSVVHFTCVFAACLIAISPLRSWLLLGCLIGGDGLFGVVYAGTVLRRMMQHGLIAGIDLEDRFWYAALPAAGYAIILAAGIMLATGHQAGCEILAIALGLLTVAGIRNAWDITVWTMVNRGD